MSKKPACTVKKPDFVAGFGFDVAVDVGTSPHGLSADLHLADQETPEAASLHSPAKPLLTLPLVYRSEKLRSDCRKIKAAAAEHHYPLVLTGAQMKLVESAVSLAIDEAIEALNCEPADVHHEIQPYVDSYNQIYRLLCLAKSARKGEPGDHWQGDML